jgi:hypothetical protein
MHNAERKLSLVMKGSRFESGLLLNYAGEVTLCYKPSC